MDQDMGERCRGRFHPVVRGALAVVLLMAATGCFALPDELQVQTDDIREPGRLGADVGIHYAFSAPRLRTEADTDSTAHLLQISPEFSWGVSGGIQLGVQLFASVAPGGAGKADGIRGTFFHLPFHPEEEGGDGWFLGYLAEVGRLPRTMSPNDLDADLRLVAGYRAGAWMLAANPEIGVKLSGSGQGTPELGMRLKLAHRTGQDAALGIEYYGGMGTVKSSGSLSAQSQQLFAVADWKWGGLDIDAGIGRGLNASSEPWVLKLSLGFPFGN